MREKLIELLCEAHGMATDASLFEDASYAQQLETEADSLIANGVTIPVRCKDCKHSGIVPHSKIMYCENPMGRCGCVPTKEDAFCSYGERRTDG